MESLNWKYSGSEQLDDNYDPFEEDFECLEEEQEAAEADRYDERRDDRD